MQKGGPGWLCPPLICLRQALLLPPLCSESLHHRSIFLFPSLQPECVAAHVHLWLVHSMLGQRVNMKLDVHTKFCFKYVLPGFFIECYFVAKMAKYQFSLVKKNLKKIKCFLAFGPFLYPQYYKGQFKKKPHYVLISRLAPTDNSQIYPWVHILRFNPLFISYMNFF